MQPPKSDKYSDSTVFYGSQKFIYYFIHVYFNKFQYLQIFGFLDLVTCDVLLSLDIIDIIDIIYGQESPGWISIYKLAFFLLKIYRNINFLDKLDWSMSSRRQWAKDR